MLHGSGRSWAKGVQRVAQWDLDHYSEEECWEQLRWRKEDIPMLAVELGLPPLFKTSKKGYVFTREEATVVLLRRYAHAGTWEGIQGWLGGRSRSTYVELVQDLQEILWDRFSDKVTGIDRWAHVVDVWADAIHASGPPAPRCIGFIDGTLRATCRPTDNQREVYSGYKKVHGLKFQSVTAPNGLIVDFFGPVLGRRGDGYMLGKSGLYGRMQRLCLLTGAPYYVYGDPAYPQSQYILRGFKGPATAAQKAFSKSMSSARVSVEWNYMIGT